MHRVSKLLETARAAGLLCAAALAVSPSVQAQVFEIRAGASTATDAQGGTLIMHTQRYESSIGIGLQDGVLCLGGAATRLLRDGTATLGQQQFVLELPTDLFTPGRALIGTGLGLKRDLPSGSHLNAFGGFLSQDAGTTLFASARLLQPAGYFRWSQHISSKIESTTSIMSNGSPTVLESLSLEAAPHLHLAVTGGVGREAPYLAASLAWEHGPLHLRAAAISAGKGFLFSNGAAQPMPEPVGGNIMASYRLTRDLTFTGAHENYRVPTFAPSAATASTSDAASSNSINQLSVDYHHRANGLSASIFHATTTATTGSAPRTSTSMAFTADRKFGPLRITETYLRSVAEGSSPSSSLLSTLSAQVHSRLRLDGTATLSGGTVTVEPGGEFITAFSSMRASYQLLYLPDQPQQPFQQALVFDARVQLMHRLALVGSSSINAVGRTLYSFGVSTVVARQNGASEQPRTRFGLNVVSGIVVDEHGQPLEGATLLVGTHRLYTDSGGGFVYREPRTHSYKLTVLTGEFVAEGGYEVVEAPAEVRLLPEQQALPVHIVVRHVPMPYPRAVRASEGDL